MLGLVAGWLAGQIARGHGYGCVTDILLGLIGSVLGGWIFRKLEIGGSGGSLYSLAAATVGAVVLVYRPSFRWRRQRIVLLNFL